MNDNQSETPHCPNCGEEVTAKAIACKHCGELLKEIDGNTLQTIVVRRPSDLATSELDDAPQFPQGTGKFNSDIIYLSVERLNTPIARYVTDNPIVLGRDETGAETPLQSKDIDLSPYNARERGVSRRHVQIFEEDGELFLEDLGSSNGTAVNGNLVPPGQVQKLHDGDEIILGRMMIWVNF